MSPQSLLNVVTINPIALIQILVQSSFLLFPHSQHNKPLSPTYAIPFSETRIIFPKYTYGYVRERERERDDLNFNSYWL
jgi:hypothetical protein